ncbi:MAG: bile acid:sodium symporter family protein [Pirellulaceae bacterium]
MNKFIIKYWFLLGLAVALVAGYWFAAELDGLSSNVWLRRVVVMVVMFLMALPLSFNVIAKTVRHPWPALLASAINFGLLPVIAWLFSGLLDSFSAAGLLVAAAAPGTLASAAVWTRRAGGNEVTALMTTVITNGLCFVVTPLLVFLMLNAMADIGPAEMTGRLALLVLVPICVAQLCRIHPGTASWATVNKTMLGVLAQIGILIIVLLGTSQTTLRLPADQMPGWLSIVWIGVVCAIVHVAALASGFVVARLLGMPREEQIAVAISGSQKTLMVGLLVCLMLNITLLPMVIYHAVQLVCDTLFADWARRQSPDNQAGPIS